MCRLKMEKGGATRSKSGPVVDFTQPLQILKKAYLFLVANRTKLDILLANSTSPSESSSSSSIDLQNARAALVVLIKHYRIIKKQSINGKNVCDLVTPNTKQRIQQYEEYTSIMLPDGSESLIDDPSNPMTEANLIAAILNISQLCFKLHPDLSRPDQLVLFVNFSSIHIIIFK